MVFGRKKSQGRRNFFGRIRHDSVATICAALQPSPKREKPSKKSAHGKKSRGPKAGSAAKIEGRRTADQIQGVFKEEAKQVDSQYAPKTVNTDGWGGTIGAWSALFPMIVIIRCFLHAWLRIRERGKKLENFFELGEKVWSVYHAETRRIMSQRIRRLAESRLGGFAQRLGLGSQNASGQ